MGSIPTLVRVFLCPCVGPFPSVGLTLTWFVWDRNLALHITLYSVNSIHKQSSLGIYVGCWSKGSCLFRMCSAIASPSLTGFHCSALMLVLYVLPSLHLRSHVRQSSSQSHRSLVQRTGRPWDNPKLEPVLVPVK